MNPRMDYIKFCKNLIRENNEVISAGARNGFYTQEDIQELREENRRIKNELLTLNT